MKIPRKGYIPSREVPELPPDQYDEFWAEEARWRNVEEGLQDVLTALDGRLSGYNIDDSRLLDPDGGLAVTTPQAVDQPKLIGVKILNKTNIPRIEIKTVDFIDAGFNVVVDSTSGSMCLTTSDAPTTQKLRFDPVNSIISAPQGDLSLDAGSTGVVKARKNLVPSVANNYTLGTSTLDWQVVYGRKVHAPSSDLTLDAGSTNVVVANKDIVPASAGSADLGDLFREWGAVNTGSVQNNNIDVNGGYLTLFGTLGVKADGSLFPTFDDTYSSGDVAAAWASSYTNIIDSKEKTSNPTSPASGRRRLFAKSDGWYDLNSSGVATKLGAQSLQDVVFVKPGENIQAALDSVAAGGVVVLLPGVHSISSAITLNNSKKLIGWVDSRSGSAEVKRTSDVASIAASGDNLVIAYIKFTTEEGVFPISPYINITADLTNSLVSGCEFADGGWTERGIVSTGNNITRFHIQGCRFLCYRGVEMNLSTAGNIVSHLLVAGNFFETDDYNIYISGSTGTAFQWARITANMFKQLNANKSCLGIVRSGSCEMRWVNIVGNGFESNGSAGTKGIFISGASSTQRVKMSSIIGNVSSSLAEFIRIDHGEDISVGNNVSGFSTYFLRATGSASRCVAGNNCAGGSTISTVTGWTLDNNV